MRICFDDGGREFRIEFETAAQLGEILIALRGAGAAPVERLPRITTVGDPPEPTGWVQHEVPEPEPARTLAEPRAPKALTEPRTVGGRSKAAADRRQLVAGWMLSQQRVVRQQEILDALRDEFPSGPALWQFLTKWMTADDCPIVKVGRGGYYRHRDVSALPATDRDALIRDYRARRLAGRSTSGCA